MKLFFLLIPFIGINCIPNCFKNRNEKKAVEVKKTVNSYQILPSTAVFQFN